MKKISVLLLCISMLLPMFSMVGAAHNTAKIPDDEEMTAEIASALGGANGIVTMIFDDGNWDTAEWLNEKFKEYDLRGTCAMILKYINDSNVKQWQALFAEGYLEPQNHSRTHLMLPAPEDSRYEANKQNNTDDNFTQEIITSANLMRQYFGELPLCYVVPYYSIHPDAMSQYVKKQYYATRQSNPWQIGSYFQSLDPKPGSDKGGDWYNLYMHPWKGEEKGEILRGIDYAAEEGGWCITMCHAIGRTMSESVDSSYALTEPVLQYLSELQSQGKVWVTTFGDATKYVRERQNTTVSYRESNGVYTLQLSMAQKTADNLPLDPDVFDHPLTVQVSVPDGYAGAYYYERGVGRFAEAKEKDGKRYAYIDAMPNGDAVSLSFVKTAHEEKAPTLRGTLNEGGVFSEGMGMISSVSPSKILLGIDNHAENSFGKANITLQFGSIPTEDIRVWGVDPTLAASMSVEELYALLAEETVPQDLIGKKPLARLSPNGKSYEIDICDYMNCAAGNDGLLLIDTAKCPASGITLMDVSVMTDMLLDGVYYSESHLQLHHSLRIENELLYTVYFAPSETINAIHLNDTIYTKEKIATLPTVKVGNQELCSLSIPVSLHHAATPLSLRFEIATKNGTSAFVEPRLSVLAYLDALLAKETDEDVRVMLLDLMLLIRSSVQFYAVGSDVSAVASALKKYDYSPLLTGKLVGAVAKVPASVEKIGLRLDGVPSFLVTPKDGMTYTFHKPNGDRIEHTTETVDGVTVYVLPIRTFHLFLPITVNAEGAEGSTSEDFTLANYFATLTGKEREVVKYAAAFAASFDVVRDKKE